jgi:hypothetical protein
MRTVQWKHKISAVLGATLALAGAGGAQSITPDKVVATISVGETFTIKKTITLGAGGATNVDLFFLADNTGSMGGIVNNAQSGASAILNNFGTGFQYGVGRYLGDPSEVDVAPGTAFQLQQNITSNKSAAQAAINSWFASGGGDTPEAGFFALKGTAETTAWRGGAQRIVVWFGDATSHTATVTQAQAIAALQAKGVKVVAFNSLGAGLGIDGTFGGTSSQASGIVAGAGGSLTNNFNSLTPAQFVSTVNSSIEAATSTLDLSFFHTLLSSGLDISFRCTDVLGCLNVGGGQSRTFEVDIKGMSEGVYKFDIGARGVDALENDLITVVGTGTVVPEPATVVLMGTGLLGLAGIVRRRRNSQGS